MKKLLSLLSGWVLLCALFAGCTPESNENPPGDPIIFIGVIEEIYDQSILVSAGADMDFSRAQVSYAEGFVPSFDLIAGQTVRITILPDIAETHPVRVSATAIELIGETPAKPDGETPLAAPYTVSYIRADSSADGGKEYLLRRCLNADLLASDEKAHLPALLLAGAADLDDFITNAGEFFQLDAAYDETASFSQAATRYDDGFFETHVLLVLYAEEPSGSNRHEVQGVTIEGEHCLVSVGRITPEIGTTDMADWFILLELSREMLGGCTAFDAVIS